MIIFTVNIIGLLLIALIIWWFMIKQPKVIQAKGKVIDIVVKDGIYDPAVITIKPGQTINLRFTRHDNSPCSEIVTFPGLKVSAKLPVGKPHEITITANKAGEYDFTCQMGMYRGKLIVA